MSPLIILLLVSSYFALIFCISYYTSKKSNNETFFIGNKQSAWYVVAFGMIGASVSGVTFISVPGTVGNLQHINGQFSYLQVVMGNILGYILIATLLLPLYYRHNVTSIYGYLNTRFGENTYKTGSFFFLLSRTIGTAYRLYIAVMILQLFVFQAFGVPFFVTAGITLLVIWLFTQNGGLKTVIWTDTLQTVFMLLALIFTIFYISNNVLKIENEGLIPTILNSGYSKVFFWNGYEDRFFLKQFISGACLALAMTGLDQDLMQKNISCKTLGEAQKNMLVSSIIFGLVNVVFVSMGALLYIYAAEHGIAIPAKTDHLYPTLALQYFPSYMGALFVVGLVAAAYSSADSALISLTTAFCIDILGFEKKKTLPMYANGILEGLRKKVHLGFTFLLFVCMLVFWYALSSDVISAVFTIAGYTYGPLLGLYIFGFLPSKVQLKNKLVPVVCVLAPVLTYIVNANSVAWWGFKLGFTLLPVNALITLLGLCCISTVVAQKTDS